MIAIVTHRENFEMLENLVKSIEGVKYPVVIVVNDSINTDEATKQKYSKFNHRIIFNEKDGFELGALKRVLEETDAEEIVLLQDSCEIKDLKLFDMMFENQNSVAISETFLSYLRKYERSVLEQMKIPETKTKTESVRNEGQFNGNYMNLCQVDILFGRFGFTYFEGNRFEERFGRMNLISENDYLIKYKGTWNAEMIKD